MGDLGLFRVMFFAEEKEDWKKMGIKLLVICITNGRLQTPGERCWN